MRPGWACLALVVAVAGCGRSDEAECAADTAAADCMAMTPGDCAGRWTCPGASCEWECGVFTVVCDDGIDNDGDGAADAADPGCTGADDPDEHGMASCDDGIDDDGDG